jgi:hypothetical protein
MSEESGGGGGGGGGGAQGRPLERLRKIDGQQEFVCLGDLGVADGRAGGVLELGGVRAEGLEPVVIGFGSGSGGSGGRESAAVVVALQPVPASTVNSVDVFTVRGHALQAKCLLASAARDCDGCSATSALLAASQRAGGCSTSNSAGTNRAARNDLTAAGYVQIDCGVGVSTGGAGDELEAERAAELDLRAAAGEREDGGRSERQA